MGVHMGKSKYSIQKRVDNNKQFYDLVLHGEILFTSDNYSEVLYLTKSPSGVEYSDNEILQNLENSKNKSKTAKELEIEQKYERPGTGVDMFIVLLMIFSVVGLFILAGELRLTDLNLVIAIGALVVQLILMGAILTSRKVDRALLDRLDEVEKKLDMYKKVKEDNK
jgi:hypothetical protein